MKGISSFIATILIIAVTVAVGGIISSWMIHFVSTETKTVGSQSELEITCNDGAISLSDLKYHCPKLSGKVKNTGKIDLGNITLEIQYTNATREAQCLSYAGGTLVNATCQGNLTMSIQEEYSFNLTIGGSNYDKIRVYSANCTKVDYTAESSDVTTTC
jgi:hypothetical protein